MKLIANPAQHFSKRIILFLGFKNIPYTLIKTQTNEFPILEINEKKYIGNTLNILRDIEYAFPYPIGFIGPVETKIQWASMILTSTPSFQKIIQNQEISKEEMISYQEIFEEIEGIVEDEYFVMGPTFSVADCVLSADLSVFSSLSETLTNYITRVKKRTALV